MGSFEVVIIIFITYTIVWHQVNSREGTQLHPSIENWIKDLLNVTHQNKTQYPFSQFENHNHRKVINLITWTTALSNSMKL